MKVLQALFFPPEQPGGVSSMIPKFMNRMVENGWDMTMISLPKRVRNKGKESLPFDSFDVAQFESLPIVSKYLQVLRDYIWWIRMQVHEPYGLIHCHHPLVALAFKYTHPFIPVMLTIHSSYETELMLNGRIVRNGPEWTFLTNIYREVEEKVDVITTVSQSFKRYLGQYLKNPDRVHVVYNGYDQTIFRPNEQKQNPVPQLVSLSRLVPAKGIDVLIRSCAELKRRGKTFMLHIIGDGSARQELTDLSQQLQIIEDTIFYGYMLHPHELMSFFDIFVLPSRAEAFGSVFAEASLAGLACVGTNVGGIAEQMIDGETGLLVPVDDPIALADALERLIDDEGYRRKLADAGRDYALRHFALNRVVDTFGDIYREILDVQAWE